MKWCEFEWTQDGVRYRCALPEYHVEDPERQDHVSANGEIYDHDDGAPDT